MNDDTPQVRLTTENVIRAEFEEISHQRKQRFGKKADLCFEDVFPQNKEDAPKKVPPAKLADNPQGPVGLCFSGGGIRSATFNLGVLQGLREAGVLKFIDYLSTVSGGGYIGSWFTATNYRLAQAAADTQLTAEQKAVASDLATDWKYLDENNKEGHGSPFIHHLRKYSRYMAPKAGITSGDTWTAAAIWLRNTTLVQTMIISAIGGLLGLLAALPFLFRFLVSVAAPPVELACSKPFWWSLVCFQIVCISGVVCVCFLGIKAVNDHQRRGLGTSAFGSGAVLFLFLLLGSFLSSVQLYRMVLDGNRVLSMSPFHIDLPVLVMVLIVSALSVWTCWRSCEKSAERKRIRFWVLGILFQLAAGLLLVTAVWHLLAALVGSCPNGALTNGVALTWATLLGTLCITLGYCTIQVLAIGMYGRYFHESMREWWGRAGAWVLMGSTLFLLCGLVSIAGPLFVDWLFGEKLHSFLGSSVVISWVATTLLAVLAGKSAKTGKPGRGGVIEAAASYMPLFFLVGLLIAESWLLRQVLLPAKSCRHDYLLEAFLTGSAHSFAPFGCTVICALFLLAFILMWRLDLNEFSMNPFYRNRLVRCYLGGTRLSRDPQSVTGFDFADDLPMSALRSVSKDSKFKGPFHIVNTAINTGASAGLDVQDRSAESFIFTPLHAGFDYWRKALGTKTGDLVKQRVCYHPANNFTMEKGWTLGTALSVSGAAASPNSGYHTSPLVAFMLTIFNARLGWWTPHPTRAQAKQQRPQGVFGFLSYLMAELTGSASLNSDFVYLSDGGHFENLGLYELVRRQCYIIIVGDGECDPTYNFQALGVAIRRCRVDFGAKIEIHPRLIQPDSQTGLSLAHGAIGTITYADKTKGVLIYLKTSITGDEDRDVRQYHGENPLFPHESTGDQFYSEAQFESYRNLGRHAALKIFAPNDRLTIQDSPVAEKRLGLWEEKQTSNQKPDRISVTGLHEFYKYIGSLSDYWTPPPPVKITSFVQHTDTLMSIWRQAMSDGNIQPLDDMLLLGLKVLGRPVDATPKVGQKEPPPAATDGGDPMPRPVAYVCQQLIQLMENVYLDLDLAHDAEHKDNSGWMHVFKTWVKNHHMLAVWEKTKPTYGERFRIFWEDQLQEQSTVNTDHNPKEPKQAS